MLRTNIRWRHQVKFFGFLKKVKWSNLLCETNIAEIKGKTNTLLLQLLRELPNTCCKVFLDKTGLIPPIKHILVWYKISLNPLPLTNFPQLLKKHEIMKIPEIYNDVLQFIWINPDSFIIFLCCTHINRNMCILHVWNFRKMHWSVFCFAYGVKFCF